MSETNTKIKRCTRCQQEKPLPEFYAKKDEPGKHYPACRSCSRKRAAEPRLRNREGFLAKRREARLRNRDALNEQQRARRALKKKPRSVRPAAWDESLACYRVPLTMGLFALVDKEDLSLVSGWNWSAAKRKKTYYAMANVGRTATLMHRLITGVCPADRVDHWDGCGTNNRRKNLRICNDAQNAANRRKFHSTQPFKGVRWMAKLKKWSARIGVNYKSIHLGVFADAHSAAEAYDRAALAHFGEFAHLNFADRLHPELATQEPAVEPGGEAQ